MADEVTCLFERAADVYIVIHRRAFPLAAGRIRPLGACHLGRKKGCGEERGLVRWGADR